MSLPIAIAAGVEAALGVAVVVSEDIGGGDINEAARVTLADRRVVFVKHHATPPRELPQEFALRANDPTAVDPSAPLRSAWGAGMFAAEARGLAWLAEPGAIRVPQVLGCGERFLVLEWLAPAPRVADFDERLGRGLAMLHAAQPPGLGLDHGNYIATLPQDNAPADDWPSFWLERRLAPLVRIAVDRDRGPRRWIADLDRLAAVLPAIAGPREPAARLHGDLWSGNVHPVSDGPSLIDPAVYGGHREVDLAMLALFGTVSRRTLAAYQDVRPLADEWRDRVVLWQLYPLLVHTILFGGGYAASVQRALDRYL